VAVIRAWTLGLLLLASAPLHAAEIEIRAMDGDHLALSFPATPVSDVLDRLARQTAMKVIYEGAPPRTLVAADLTGVTPAQAVLRVLEGLGLDYAMTLDQGGGRVATLVVFAPGGSSGARALPAPAALPEPSVPAVAPGPLEVADSTPETPPPSEGQGSAGLVPTEATEDGARGMVTPSPGTPGVGAGSSPFGSQATGRRASALGPEPAGVGRASAPMPQTGSPEGPGSAPPTPGPSASGEMPMPSGGANTAAAGGTGSASMPLPAPGAAPRGPGPPMPSTGSGPTSAPGAGTPPTPPGTGS
jgi:hypothetical protein